MASHHHLLHHHSAAAATTCCCCCCTTICTPAHYSPPPDPLLQSISSHLLHHPPPQQPHLHSPYPAPPHYSPYDLPSRQTQHYPPPQHHKQKRHPRKYRPQEQYDEEESLSPNVNSLLRRIAALESSLRHRSPNPFSLRDAAARTIQTHFRAFLVRRSRTLRQLKDLAFIKSALNTLKSSLSENSRFDFLALSRESMGLLVKLDSIQGGDPMIRDGKRSISRELIRFMEFIDGISLKRQVISRRGMKNVGFGKNGTKSNVLQSDERIITADCRSFSGGESKLLEKLRNQVEQVHGFSRVCEEDEEDEEVELGNPSVSINGNYGVSQSRNGGLVNRQGGVQPKVKKNVSFAENGNVYRVFRSSHGVVSRGDDDSDDGDRELMKNMSRKFEEIRVSSKESEDDNEAAQSDDDEGSPETSQDESESTRNTKTKVGHGMRKQLELGEEENGGFVFAAPLPAKMESRADLMNKKHQPAN